MKSVTSEYLCVYAETENKIMVTIFFLHIAVLTGNRKGARAEWLGIMEAMHKEGCPALPAAKVFKPKHGLPTLTSNKEKAPPGVLGEVS